MDIVVKIAGWVSLVVVLSNIFLGPLMIGKERKPATPGTYIVNMIASILIFLLIGRCFGWW